MMRILSVLLVLFAWTAGPFAQTAETDAARDFQRIISDQIEAFKTDDGARAYGHAAPLIKQIFPTPDAFMAMVRQGYRPVYRPQSYRFGKATTDSAGRPAQRVILIGPDGLSYEATYTFEQQPDGTWLINGCYIAQVKGADA
jgi:hypothetical protein